MSIVFYEFLYNGGFVRGIGFGISFRNTIICKQIIVEISPLRFTSVEMTY